MAARRRLGRLLTELREAKGITQEAAAEFIERVPSTLYKLESGRPGVRIRIKHDIHSLCDLYEVDDTVREGLVQLAEATKVRGWFLPNQDAVPPNVEVYLGLEQDAAQLDTYESCLIPGLFQTERYARELMAIPDFRDRDGDEVDRRVNHRLQRQLALTRSEPLRLNGLVDETALRRWVGGPDVMAEQLERVSMMSELPHVSVRVLPFRVGLHWGLVTRGFVILRFPERDDPPMVYSDGPAGGLWFTAQKEIDRFHRAFSDMSEKAATETESRDLINDAAREFANYA
jgi:transcriptional regulator with XRE-family HTH domain